MAQQNESWVTGPEVADLGITAARETRQLLGPRTDRGYRGTATFDDGDNCFTVVLRGPGSLDWNYDPAVGELRILGVHATSPATEIVVVCHAGNGFHVADARIDGPLGAFRSNALFGEVAFQEQCGVFTFCDGGFCTTLSFPGPTNVHYDGALGALDATPMDGSLRLETCREVTATTTAGTARLTARTNSAAARLHWRQIGGPSLPVVEAEDGILCVDPADLAGRRAVFVVSACDGRSLALESVVLRGELVRAVG